MSIYTYNGITIPFVLTHSITNTPERDSSDTDQVWTRDTLRVRGIVADNLGMSVFAATPAEIYKVLKHRLSIDRCPLLYQQPGTFGLVDVIRVDNPPDANKGPKVGNVEVTQLLNGSWLIDMTVDTWSADCGETPANRKYVSHRYTQTEEFDENWNTSYSVRGKVRVRSDLRISADSLRGLGVPQIPDMFIRKNLSFMLSEDGLEMDYSFRDVQQYAMPPAPATKASGRFIVICQDKAKLIGQCNIRLEAPSTVDRATLMGVAMKVAYARLLKANVAANPNPPFTPLIGGSFSEELYGEMAAVDVVLTGLLVNPNTSFDQFYLKTGTGGKNPLDTTQGIMPTNLRNMLSPLLAAVFLTPCGSGTSDLVSTGPGQSDMTIGISTLSSTTGTMDDSVPTQANSSTDPPNYDYYEVETTVSRNEGRSQMAATGGPLLVSDGSSSGSSTSGDTSSQAKLSKIVRMYNPTMSMDVVWTAKRRGLPPILPSYFSADPNLKEMSGSVTPAQLEISADGFNMTYAISGNYRYAVIDPSQVSVVAPIPPFLSSTAGLGAVQSAGSTSDNVLFAFTGSSGPNPFDPASGTNSRVPTTDVTQSVGSGAAALAMNDSGLGGGLAPANAPAIGPAVPVNS